MSFLILLWSEAASASSSPRLLFGKFWVSLRYLEEEPEGLRDLSPAVITVWRILWPEKFSILHVVELSPGKGSFKHKHMLFHKNVS